MPRSAEKLQHLIETKTELMKKNRRKSLVTKSKPSASSYAFRANRLENEVAALAQEIAFLEAQK